MSTKTERETLYTLYANIMRQKRIPCKKKKTKKKS